VASPPNQVLSALENTVAPAGRPEPAATRAEVAVRVLAPSPGEAAPPAPAGEPRGPAWTLAGVLATVWLLGALACLARALGRLALLYRCARRARPVRDRAWADCLRSLARCYGARAVGLRESPAIPSPLTLGLLRAVILLPPGRRRWLAGQRTLILGHELAHVRRHDFLAGLVAEAAACLCWFHPLARWLAGRLRLEQEYAADAWVASATDATAYVRCLARLALEQGPGCSSLAPAFGRRRPEILRRIDMLQRNPKGQAPRLGKRAGSAVAVLATVACLAVAGVGPLNSAAGGRGPAAADPGTKGRATADAHGDPLPAGALARLGTTRLRHEADVTDVSFGPGGTTLLTAGRDGTVRLWDLATGKEIRRFDGPKPADPAGDRAGANRKAQSERLLALRGQRQTDAGDVRVALAPDGKTLATAHGNLIRLWEVQTGKELRTIQGTPGLAGLLFSPDGRTLAGRGSGGALVLWATDTGRQVRRIEPPPRKVGKALVLTIGGASPAAPGMAFTPDGKALAAAMTAGAPEKAVSSVTFWDMATGREVRKVPAPEGVRISAVAIAPDGKFLAYGGGGVVHLCAAETGKEVRRLREPDGGILTLVFSPDGKMLAARGANQKVRLWDVATGKELRHLGDTAPPRRSGGLVFLAGSSFGPERRALAFSPDGTRLAAAAGSTVRLWETATGKEVPMVGGHRRAPSAVALSPDGKVVVTWSADRVVRRWEATMGRPLGAFPAPPGSTRAAFAPGARVVALANADGTIRLHETATGKEHGRLQGRPGDAAALAFAPGGKVLAVRTGDGILRLYDVERGTELRRIVLRPGNGPTGSARLVLGGPAGGRDTSPGLAFSPDDMLLASAGAGNTLSFFDVATGKELRRIESPRPVSSFAFSPDGRVLAAENADHTVTLWEVASARERGRLGQPAAGGPRPGATMTGVAVFVAGMPAAGSAAAGPVGVAFAPDGRTLAVRGPDRSVRVWDVAAGKEVGRFAGHEGPVETVAFGPGGKALASGAADTTVLLWDAASLRKDLPAPPAAELSAAEVEALWDDLAGADAARALRAVGKLAGAPGRAVPFLEGRLKPAVPVDPGKIAGWIADLGSEKFAVRERASANLLKAGDQAVPAVQKACASSPSLETGRRAEALLARLTDGTLTAGQLRLIRAVEALERTGTPQARGLLGALAGGAPGALATRQAQAALDRLAGPPGPPP
jgi:WD40 repeat protein/beta-lactamase regulating signal transducer with metallopeptidase domain